MNIVEIKREIKNIAITGGMGFIGSNFIRYLREDVGFTGNILNIDKLTYAGNPSNLSDLENKYTFLKWDICAILDIDFIKIFDDCKIDLIINFAAESHVDKSIYGPSDFIKTNILGTFSLLEAVRKINKNIIFYQVGSDEVFGSLPEFGYFNEHSKYDPRSVYSASKASADHLVKAYYHTYGIPVLMSNCSNNYGPYQFPEKLIPLMILNMLERKPLPVYGDGKQIRDWLYVKDHCEAIWTIITKGEIGESYNIGGDNEKTNIEIIDILCELVSDHTGVPINVYRNLITHVTDRPGHDRRYAVNCDKIKRFLGWKQHMSFYLGMDSTVKWYIDNKKWINDIKTGEYLKWIENNYKDR